LEATADQQLHDFLAAGVTLMLIAGGLFLLVRFLRRDRPDFRIGVPLGIAFAVRVLAAAAVSLTGIGEVLRGGDEVGFLAQAHEVAAAPFGSELWSDALTGELFKFVFAAQIGLFDPPEFVLRITQAGIAVAGLALMAAAVYELAGARAATISIWVLALEPANIFFSTLLHKEANMILAAGLVVFGGTLLWKHGRVGALVPMVLGCLVGLATRPYAAWFLVVASALITLHAGLRAQHRTSFQGAVAVVVVVLVAAVGIPSAIEATSEENLEGLQASQTANVSDENANLALEEVDYSTRGAIVTNLPTRIGDVLFRPYPWQIDNASQQLGLVGTIAALALLAFLLRELFLNRGAIMTRAGPILYTLVCLLIAYSLSAGNAGTAFRYRTHLVAMGVCVAVALWSARKDAVAAATVDQRAAGARDPLPAT
jgi:hypothetical protein